MEEVKALPGVGHDSSLPAFIINNLRNIQAQGVRPYRRFVKIKDGVLSITNGSVMTRTKVSGIADGFYQFDNRNLLVPCDSRQFYEDEEFMPDVDALKPNFNTLIWGSPIPMETSRLFIEYLSHVRELCDIKSHVIIDDAGVSSMNYPNAQFNAGVKLPVKGLELFFQWSNLYNIFVDVLKYESVCLGIDPYGTPKGYLMLLGRSWDECNMIRGRKPTQ